MIPTEYRVKQVSECTGRSEFMWPRFEYFYYIQKKVWHTHWFRPDDYTWEYLDESYDYKYRQKFVKEKTAIKWLNKLQEL